MATSEISNEVGKYFSAEESLSSASLEDGESSIGSAETDENLQPLVGSTESVKNGPLQKEVITDVDAILQRDTDMIFTSLDLAAGSERHIITTAGKKLETMKFDDSHSENLASTICEQDPQTSTNTVKSSLRKRPQTSRLGDNNYSMHVSSDILNCSSSTLGSMLGTHMPVYGKGLKTEIEVQPKTYTGSLIETPNSAVAQPCSREIPASDTISGTTFSILDSISMDVSEIATFGKFAETSQLHATEGDKLLVTSHSESDDENELDSYHRGGNETLWGIHELDHEDRSNDLRLEGDLDDHRMKKHDTIKTPKETNESEDSLFLWPAALLTKTIDFQIKIILFGLSVVMWLVNLFVVEPINMLFLGGDTAVVGISNIRSLIVNAMQSLGHFRSQVGTTLKKVAKKLGIGVLTATYVSVILSLLLIPALLLDFLIVGRFVERPIEIHERLYFDYTQPTPSAAVSLFPAHIMPKVKALAATHPEKIVNRRLVPLNHKFHVTVILKMPESEHNLHIGMFQVSAELISMKGHLIARFTRPCMLYFHSWPIRYAKTVLLAMPLLLGLYSESQVVVIQLIEAYEDKTEPAASVKVLLEPRAGFLPGAGLPEVYSADVIIQSQLPWAKLVVYHWKWTFYVWSGFGLFFFEVALVLCCCRQVLFPLVPSRESNRAESRGQEQNQNNLTAIQENLASPSQSQGRGRVSFQDDIPIGNVSFKPGSSATDIQNEEREELMGTKEDLDMS